MEEIAPGAILQRMYLKRRIRNGHRRTFCEIGSGNGHISNILLRNGLTGIGFDLNEDACENNRLKNKEFIDAGKYTIISSNFLEYPLIEKFDMIISSMVIEHLDDDSVYRYFESCKQHLNSDGRIVVFVPSSMKYWGIEDEIAGHHRRYEHADLCEIAKRHSLVIKDIAGLTYPLSNLLFSLSNRLVEKHEINKKNLTMRQKTVLSGNRNVKYKTSFPRIYKLVLNEIALYPFDVLQRIFKDSRKSMVTYCEYAIKQE